MLVRQSTPRSSGTSLNRSLASFCGADECPCALPASSGSLVRVPAAFLWDTLFLSECDCCQFYQALRPRQTGEQGISIRPRSGRVLYGSSSLPSFAVCQFSFMTGVLVPGRARSGRGASDRKASEGAPGGDGYRCGCILSEQNCIGTCA
jgi:hypothetical protein